MKPSDWNHIKHFKPNENWGDPTKMEFGVIFILDAFREYIERKIIVTSGIGKRETSGSQHPSGKAVDFVVECYEYGKLNMIFDILRFPFMGVGVYPNHAASGMKSPIGFHVDSRESNHRALWIGITDLSGKFHQTGLNQTNLKYYGVIR